MFIEFLNVTELDPVSTKQGEKAKCEVTYLRDGKKQSRKLVGFTAEQAKVVEFFLSEANKGATYEVKLEKDGEYYNWVGIKDSDVKPGSSYKANAGGKTFETPAERVNRQILIVRQSSLTSAIAYHQLLCKDGGSAPSESALLKTADLFTKFVFHNITDMGEAASLPVYSGAPTAAAKKEKEDEAPKAQAKKVVKKAAGVGGEFTDDIPWDDIEE